MALVYVVDDELNVRRIVKQTMENEENEVHTFATAEEALEAIDKRQPDLIFMDLTLPLMAGIHLLQELQKKAYAIPVIVVSAITSPEAIRTAFKLGITDFLTKPFTPQELRQAADLALKDEESLSKRSREIRRLIEAGEMRKAQALLRDFFADFPSSPQPHFLYALLIESTNPRVAAKHLRASLCMDEDFKEASSLLKKLEE